MSSEDVGVPTGSIDRHLDALWLERGLGRATLNAYRQDLEGLQAWLERDPAEASEADLRDYMASRLEAGHSARSISRFLSAVRGFYRKLVEDGVLERDPSANLDRPRLGRPLPATLSEAEVERLLNAPDSSDPTGNPIGFRDRTMLETLYATGLRVSELVGLTLSSFSDRRGTVQVIGKGGRERLTPVGEVALDWLRQYSGPRPSGAAAGPRFGRALPEQSRRCDDPTDVLARGEASRRRRWHRSQHLAAHPAPRLRDASGQPRRRPARGATDARPRRPLHDADLHARGASTPEGTARRAPPARLRRAERNARAPMTVERPTFPCPCAVECRLFVPFPRLSLRKRQQKRFIFGHQTDFAAGGNSP